MSSRDRGGRGRGDRGRGDRGRGSGGPSRGGGFSGFDRGRAGAGAGGGARIYRPAGGIPRPSEAVTRAEEDYLKQIKSTGLPDLSKLKLSDGDGKYPPRPAYGTTGKPVVLWANYFELTAPSKLQLYRYEVKVTERSKNQDVPVVGKKLTQVFRLILDLPPLKPYRSDIVTDFKAFLLSRVKLDTQKVQSLPARIQYRHEGEDEPRVNAPFYNITITEAGSVDVSDLTAYLTSTDPSATFDKQPILQALNIFLGHYAKNSPHHTTIGANRSFLLDQRQQQSQDLSASLRAIRGFFSSVRVATARILVNVNINHAAFYDATELVMSMQNFERKHGKNKFKLQAFLKRVRVETNHLKPTMNKAGISIPRIKTIFALANRNDGREEEHPPRVAEFGAGPTKVEFWLSRSPPGASSGTPSAPGAPSSGKTTGKKGKGKSATSSSAAPPAGGQSGEYISVAKYFFDTYNIRTNPELSVVNTGTTAKPAYLPAEVCFILPGQSSQAKLDPDQTAGMIQFAVRRPWLNAQSIERDAPNIVGLSAGRNSDLTRFGVGIAATMITVPGRVLASPVVQYKLGNKDTPGEMFPGSWNQWMPRTKKQLQFQTGRPLASWAAVMISMRGFGYAFRNPQVLSDTIAKFQKALNDAGVSAQAPSPPRMINMSDAEDTSLEEALRAATENLLLVILPAKHTMLYNRVKHIADTKVGLLTICVVGDKLSNGHPSYFANVALKFNLKLGGVNQKLDDAKLGIISEGRTMVVGIDVTHPSPGSAENAQSVAGMVASIDKALGQWPAVLQLNGKKEKKISEQVTNLDAMLQSRLELWRKKGGNKNLPENILIYRDGVSEGQYSMVLSQELPQLREACRKVYPATDTKKGLPHISIIVVGKRHHTRFFPTSEDSKVTNSKTDNPCNGTVVDRHVTEARNWDFFLQSHNALQGTARPAHYFVVLDEIFTSRRLPPGFQNHADVLEDLTHNMCYMFGRATKAVSICPPAYYADLVCERARCYLAGHFDMSTPLMTPAVSEAGDGGLGDPTQNDITIHPRVRDAMFYI